MKHLTLAAALCAASTFVCPAKADENIHPAHLAIVTPTTDTSVTLDGDEVRPTELATETIAVGNHTIVASAPGKLSWTTTVAVTADASVVVPELTDVPPPPPPPVAATSKPLFEFPPKPGTSWWKLVSFGMGGVGLAAFGGAALFAFESKTQWDDSNKYGHCVRDDCDSAGRIHRDSASRYRTTTTAFAASGLGFLSAGALMYVLTPSTTVMPTLGGASLTHKF